MSAGKMRLNVKQTKKLKRVSWAPGSNLCQVKHFLSEDCPSEVGKKSDQFHVFPPDFEGVQNQGRKGETREFPANYPHISAIPSRSPFSVDVEECNNDNSTPLIPIEERKESGNDVNHDDAITKLVMKDGADFAAAFAIATAISNDKEKGNLIDLNLLPEILNDPTVIEKIIYAYKTAVTINVSSPEVVVSSTSANMHSPNEEQVGPTIPSAVKDANYYKQLIRKHGTDKRDSKPVKKISKNCNSHAHVTKNRADSLEA